MSRRHLKCSKLTSVGSVSAVLAFSIGTRDLKKAETQLMTILGLADRQVKLTTVARMRELIRANRCLNIPELCRGWSVLWNFQGNTDARFQHSTCCRKISSVNSHRREGMALAYGNKEVCGKDSQMKTF